jgi:hypothetical protein
VRVHHAQCAPPLRQAAAPLHVQWAVLFL